MADTQVLPDYVWEQAKQNGQRSEPRRLRGLRFPVIPTGSWLAQVGGGIAALTGVFLEFGGPVALIVGGTASVVLGALKEAGLLDAPAEDGKG